ncbi:MAG: YggS family pyridoxal phosphate-dependent enzyme [Planctomycetaceae bacterium]
MTTWQTQLERNYRRVLDRIAAACARSGRNSADVTLVAVTKYAGMDAARGLWDLGVQDLGESRPQQLLARAAELPAGVVWHLVGHLQRNKVRGVLPVAQWIHSVDSFRLLDRIELLSREMDLRPRVLLEVNVSGEAAKHGFAPHELTDEPAALLRYDHLEIVGLMTMAPLSDVPEDSRPVFRGLRELRDRLAETGPLPELSMGMSNDFEIAIEEGATLVRVGSVLFEGV